jgi:hypothetical protein
LQEYYRILICFYRYELREVFLDIFKEISFAIESAC